MKKQSNIFKANSLSSIYSHQEEDKLQTYQDPHAENRITSVGYEELVLKKLVPFAKYSTPENQETPQPSYYLKRENLFRDTQSEIGIEEDEDYTDKIKLF